MCVYLSVWFLCASGLVGHITWWLFVQSTKCATLASLQTFGVKLLASLITALHVVTQCSQSTYLGFWASGVSTTNEVITTSLSDFSSLSGQVRRVKICKSMISLCAPPPNLSRCHTHLSDTSKFQQKFMVNMMISLVSLMKPANCPKTVLLFLSCIKKKLLIPPHRSDSDSWTGRLTMPIMPPCAWWLEVWPAGNVDLVNGSWCPLSEKWRVRGVHALSY